jgi:hypothetical protein
MAIGDDAVAAGFPLVPDSGESGRVRWGAQEINRTRDFVAQVKTNMPVGKAAFRTSAGITAGIGDPVGGNEGDIHFKIIG